MVRGGAAVAVALSVFLTSPVTSGTVSAQERSTGWLPVAIRAPLGLRPSGAVQFVRSDRKARPHARRPIPPLPVRKTAKGASAEPEPDVWPEKKIAEALARCTKLLKKIDAVVVHQPPLKEGKCGSPAPVRLISLGKKNKVSFSPPALLDCRMVAALHKWIEKHVQPLAKKHLGEPIAKVSVMSDYSCRKSTGRRNRWSQHAFADALDIRGFVTQSGRTAHVLNAWGETQRDVAARIAAIKAEAKRQQAARRGAKDAAKSAKSDDDTAAKSAKALLLAARLDGRDAARKNAAKKKSLRNRALVASLGRDVPPIPLPQDRPPKPESKFLRSAHAAACRIFGTTLGPEANEAHRNHFHVDMAERRYKKICD